MSALNATTPHRAVSCCDQHKVIWGSTVGFFRTLCGQPSRAMPSGSCEPADRAGLSQSASWLRKSRRHRRWPAGAAVVEFAIVAPVFFLFVIGIIEFGRMVMVQQVITNASREGARVAVLDGATTEEVIARARAILLPAGIRNPQIVVDPHPPSVAPAGAPVSVTVRVPFSDVSWLPAPVFLRNLTLQATTVMRRETI